VPDALRARFVGAGQGHVFKFLDEGKLTAEQASALIKQLEAIDVTLVNELFAATTAAAASEAASGPVAAKLEPATGVTDVTKSDRAEEWRAHGMSMIARGEVAALILAGGQGTRLGFDRPKGEYDVSLPSHKTIFQIQAERILRLKALAAAGAAAGSSGTGAPLPLYVMTSPMTDADTRAFWAEHAYFGLPVEDVFFFCQGTLPSLSMDGKILLETGWKVAENPDGNGGIYRALHLSGAVADMRKRGVKGVHVFAVDNVIVRAADPTFVGYCDAQGCDMGSKVCAKAGPHEKVGVLCKRDGTYTVVEYSEMDAATAEMTNTGTGELTFNAGNICIHYFTVDFLATTCAPEALPKVYHLAKKNILTAHPDTGKTMSKAEQAAVLGHAGNNGIKLESFIFDVFPRSKHMAVLQVPREAEFSPVKNAPGSADDSPDTARALVSALHGKWLASAGVSDAASFALVEVSPLASYGGEGLPAGSLPAEHPAAARGDATCLLVVTPGEAAKLGVTAPTGIASVGGRSVVVDVVSA